ncbi:hypothetical protein JQ593_18100 [Bradyrhizobium viridifuturi]|uniref:hypothetical protein n=1 Tax=uncultured Bradyrhizobium sp. TaxID=199684 RepID=UPI001BAA9924|nr:hypothetical protein [uncultured Bradyrhizobium sp.]MBR1040717.1 hypothetical protein [Bradyrhizobium viridifuturi]MBR1075005.1 hypothetical protein [Bradyrhizobium viridifuturi]
MSKQSHTHETVAWAKQRLDDVDAIISQIENTAGRLAEGARKESDAALIRLKESRAKLQKYYDDLRTDADALKRGTKKIQDAFDAEWVEVEAAFRSFLSTVQNQAETAHDVVIARARAQRQSWETSMKDFRAQAEDAVEKARGELDTAINRLSEQADRFQARIGKAKDAGDESWTAVKAGLAEAKTVHDRTIQKIKDSLSRLF